VITKKNISQRRRKEKGEGEAFWGFFARRDLGYQEIIFGGVFQAFFWRLSISFLKNESDGGERCRQKKKKVVGSVSKSPQWVASQKGGPVFREGAFVSSIGKEAIKSKI